MRDDKRVAGRLPPLGSLRIPDDFTVAEAHCSLGRVPARPAHRVTVKYDRATEIAARQRLQPFTEEASMSRWMFPSPIPGIQIVPAIFSCGTGFQIASFGRL